jgi:hypothetical protein
LSGSRSGEWNIEVQEVLKKVNEGKSERYKMTPQKLGRKLKAMGIQRKKIHGYSYVFLNSHDFNLLLQQYGFEIQESQEPGADDDWCEGTAKSPDERVMASIVINDNGEKLYRVKGESEGMTLEEYASFVLSYDGGWSFEKQDIEELKRRISEENFLIINDDIEPDDNDEPEPDDEPEPADEQPVRSTKPNLCK